MNKLIAAAAVLIIIAIGGAYFVFNKTTSPKVPEAKESPSAQSFQTPKKSAHWESNTPQHGQTIAAVPLNVVINFNFDLADPSEIKIEKDGKDFGTGETAIDTNKLSMRRNMDGQSPDGIYTVAYNACWPDGSCHQGSFQFAIDRAEVSSYQDLTRQSAVTIKMSQIKFMPENIKIRKGTTVTWVNEDDVDHYVNTDSHPAHTYFPQQNSKALTKGDSYSTTFDTTGIYPYHCSAHADKMLGSIIVD